MKVSTYSQVVTVQSNYKTDFHIAEAIQRVIDAQMVKDLDNIMTQPVIPIELRCSQCKAWNHFHYKDLARLDLSCGYCADKGVPPIPMCELKGR